PSEIDAGEIRLGQQSARERLTTLDPLGQRATRSALDLGRAGIEAHGVFSFGADTGSILPRCSHPSRLGAFVSPVEARRDVAWQYGTRLYAGPVRRSYRRHSRGRWRWHVSQRWGLPRARVPR